MHDTRESWLRDACKHLEPILRDAGVGLADVRVSCGWPARGALSRKQRRIGECWHAEGNADGQGHVFVSPVLEVPVKVGEPDVLGTLLHELVHAALPLKAKHGKGFAKVAHKCGLEGKPTATVTGAGLAQRLNDEVLPHLGPYPHRALDPVAKIKKQTTRLRLYECQCVPDKESGVTDKARVASDVWQAVCQVCGADFVLQVPEGDGE